MPQYYCNLGLRGDKDKTIFTIENIQNKDLYTKVGQLRIHDYIYRFCTIIQSSSGKKNNRQMDFLEHNMILNYLLDYLVILAQI